MSVILRPPGRSDVEIEFVVDTGFEGFLTLQIGVVNELQLPYVARIDANLADDSSIAAFAYRVTVVWNGLEREVIVLGIGRRPLIGTALLEDCHLGIDFCDGGTVLIDEMQVDFRKYGMEIVRDACGGLRLHPDSRYL